MEKTGSLSQMINEFSGKKIIHVSAWAEALWHFRMPLIRRNLQVFDKVALYCSDQQYCRTREDALSSDGHVRRLLDEGLEVKTGPIDCRPSMKLPFQVWRLYRYLRAERFDIVMTHQPMGSLVGITAAFFARTILRIYTTGGLKYVPNKGGMTNFVYKYVEMLLIGMSHAVFLVNREDEEYLKSIGIRNDKVIYVGPSGGCGIDTERYNSENRAANRKQARAELVLADDTYVIGYSGRCVWEKGFKEIIESAERLVANNRLKRIKFLIVGTGVDLPVIKDEIARKGLEDYFLFLGYKFNVDYYLSAFDIFILPSYREGLPISLLECMATGLPCIATNIRGCRELICNDKTGILIPPGSSTELAAAIYRLTTTPAKAKLLGTAAEQSIRENYAQQKLVLNTMNIIQTLMKERRGV
jgi:glycosyltransferase involved in cell wall biosynthesis